MKKIKGPLLSLPTGDIMYHITLASGMVITNPSAFGVVKASPLFVPAIVAENGQILAKQQVRMLSRPKLEDYEPGATEEEVLTAIDKAISTPKMPSKSPAPTSSKT